MQLRSIDSRRPLQRAHILVRARLLPEARRGDRTPKSGRHKSKGLRLRYLATPARAGTRSLAHRLGKRSMAEKRLAASLRRPA